MGQEAMMHLMERSAVATGIKVTVLLLLSAAAEAAPSGGRYSSRPLTLERGTLRLDFAPPDFALLDSGEINEGRGVAFTRVNADETYFGIGAGLSYAVTDDVELGALLLPLLLRPYSRYGDAEAYGRFRLVSGRFQLALQAAVQLPTHTVGGVAFGVPMLARVGESARIDFGPEIEVLLPRTGPDGDRAIDPRASLDFPFAVSWDLGEGGFLGLRTGVYVPEMHARDTGIKFGLQGGPILADGDVDLVFWWLWPWLFQPGRDDHRVNAGHFQIGIGVSVRIGT